MVATPVAMLIDALRELNLLRTEQFNQLTNEISPKYTEPSDLAKHLVRLGWITLYQAKKLVGGHSNELVIGNYLILDKLGEGGMGKVYKAKQVRLSRLVALKVVRNSLIANETALKRFQREAKAAAQLAHPNIVRLFDADQVGDRHFLAMEYVEGSDLSKLAKDGGTLPIGMACSFIRQAASGLQHAHDLGLIHRDIKPSNLLVTTPPKNARGEPGGVIKILDMGLARLNGLPDDDSGASALTQDGTVVGTPDFMSPEQGKNSSSVDARSDLYSLGCTLYFLLAGQPPFPHGTTLEKLLQHQIDPPKPVRELRPDIPVEVAQIVHKLLAKKPEDRHQSGSELAQALEPWSVWDFEPERLKSSGKLPRPQIAPEALPVNQTPKEPVTKITLHDPFDFDESVALPPLPPPPTLENGKKKQPLPQQPQPVQPKQQKKRPWLLAITATVFVLFAGGFFIIRGMGSPPPKPNDQSQSKDDTRPPKKDAPITPIRKVDPDTIDFFLPHDTEIVAVLNVAELNKSKFFQENMLPEFKDFVGLFKSNIAIDPFQAVERVVIGIPAGNPSQSLIILQGKELATTPLQAWVAKLPGVTVSQERIPGASQPRDIYRLPGKKQDNVKEDDLYGAIAWNTPSTIVLSPSRDRVVDTLVRSQKRTEARFEDPTIRMSIAKYPTKAPPALWVCIGAETKIFEMASVKKVEKIATPKDGGITSTVGVFRLSDSLTFELDIEAKTRQQASIGWGRLAAFFRVLSISAKSDGRFERLATLIQNAVAAPLKGMAKQENPNLHQWSNTVPADKLAEWFAPFLAPDLGTSSARKD